MNKQKEQNLSKNKCNAKDVIFDIKTIMQDFYFAQFTSNGNELSLLLNNGQKFKITVNECIN